MGLFGIFSKVDQNKVIKKFLRLFEIFLIVDKKVIKDFVRMTKNGHRTNFPGQKEIFFYNGTFSKVDRDFDT